IFRSSVTGGIVIGPRDDPATSTAIIAPTLAVTALTRKPRRANREPTELEVGSDMPLLLISESKPARGVVRAVRPGPCGGLLWRAETTFARSAPELRGRRQFRRS